jgi:hypothetical protein
MVQNALGYVASMAEGIKNTFNFSVPFLSWLAIAILIGVTFVLYFISLRCVLQTAAKLQNFVDDYFKY